MRGDVALEQVECCRRVAGGERGDGPADRRRQSIARRSVVERDRLRIGLPCGRPFPQATAGFTEPHPGAGHPRTERGRPRIPRLGFREPAGRRIGNGQLIPGDLGRGVLGERVEPEAGFRLVDTRPLPRDDGEQAGDSHREPKAIAMGRARTDARRPVHWHAQPNEINRQHEQRRERLVDVMVGHIRELPEADVHDAKCRQHRQQIDRPRDERPIAEPTA